MFNKLRKILSGESEDSDIMDTGKTRKKDTGELQPPIPKATQKKREKPRKPSDADPFEAVFLYLFDKYTFFLDEDKCNWLARETLVTNPKGGAWAACYEGFLEDAPIKDKLSKLKKAELECILYDFRMDYDSKKKKEDLIQEITKNIPEKRLKRYFPFKMYKPTEKGREFMQEQEDYIQLYEHKEWGISLREYYKYLSKCKKDSGFYNNCCTILEEHKKQNLLEYGAEAHIVNDEIDCYIRKLKEHI